MGHRLKFAGKIAGRHLLVSLLVAIVSAAFVFFVLYPYPYYLISGSLSIFMLMMLVDVSSGPLCTFVIASPKKSKKATILDVMIIGAVQLLALSYGLYSLYIARPVIEVYEKGNFHVVMANEVEQNEFVDALPQYQKLPLIGIQTLGVRKANNEKEQFESISLALAGIEIGQRPGWWIPYQEVRHEVSKNMMPLKKLVRTLSKNNQLVLQKALEKYHLLVPDTYFLPLTNSKYEDWVVLLNMNADIVGYAQIKGAD